MLLPLNIIGMDPKGLGGVDNAGLCRCGDMFEYVLKDVDQHPFTPHSEWLCTKLAERVGIAVPHCAMVENGAGGHYFGSRWEGPRIQPPWHQKVGKEIEFDAVAPVLSRIFAFDLFVHNDDRHLQNYVARETPNGWGLHAIDFSRAWMFNGFPPPPLPLAAATNTIYWHRQLKRLIGDFFIASEANAILDALATIRAPTIERIIKDHDPKWLPPAERRDVLSWWRSAEKDRRIEDIRKGIASGAYL